MPSKSKAQQRFFGMVLAAQRGKKPASKEVAKAASSMSEKSAKDFASTKTMNLPQHKEIISALERRLKSRKKS